MSPIQDLILTNQEHIESLNLYSWIFEGKSIYSEIRAPTHEAAVEWFNRIYKSPYPIHIYQTSDIVTPDRHFIDRSPKEVKLKPGHRRIPLTLTDLAVWRPYS